MTCFFWISKQADFFGTSLWSALEVINYYPKCIISVLSLLCKPSNSGNYYFYSFSDNRIDLLSNIFFLLTHLILLSAFPYTACLILEDWLLWALSTSEVSLALILDMLTQWKSLAREEIIGERDKCYPCSLTLC